MSERPGRTEYWLDGRLQPDVASFERHSSGMRGWNRRVMWLPAVNVDDAQRTTLWADSWGVNVGRMWRRTHWCVTAWKFRHSNCGMRLVFSRWGAKCGIAEPFDVTAAHGNEAERRERPWVTR